MLPACIVAAVTGNSLLFRATLNKSVIEEKLLTTSSYTKKNHYSFFCSYFIYIDNFRLILNIDDPILYKGSLQEEKRSG